MNIIRLQKQHGTDLARLHLSFLRTPFCGRAGLELLSIYYQGIADEVGAVGFAAEDNSKIVGYICGIWSPGSLKYNLAQRHFFKLTLWAAYLVISQPKMTMGLLQKLFVRPAEQSCGGYELRPIVVMTEYRATGLAWLLTQCILADALKRGYEQIHLITESDNLAAQHFYQKVGFQIRGVEHRVNGDYFCYERITRIIE